MQLLLPVLGRVPGRFGIGGRAWSLRSAGVLAEFDCRSLRNRRARPQLSSERYRRIPVESFHIARNRSPWLRAVHPNRDRRFYQLWLIQAANRQDKDHPVLGEQRRAAFTAKLSG